jgi:hypothetical protein
LSFLQQENKPIENDLVENTALSAVIVMSTNNVTESLLLRAKPIGQ